jgi:hypothetical protein
MKNETRLLVLELLTDYPPFRDSDEKLMAYIWKLEFEKMGNPIADTSTKIFLRTMAYGNFTSSESITRMRRKIQEENPSLRGEKYAKRQANQEQVKKDLGYG